MKAIILDTNILIRYPRILSLKIPDTDIFTSQDILYEVGYQAENSINGNFTFTSLLDLIQNAIVVGTLVIQPVTKDEINKISSNINYTTKLSEADKGLIAISEYLKRAYENISIATIDSELTKVLETFHLQILGGTQIQELISANKSTNNIVLEKKAEQYEKKINGKFFQGIFIGILVTVLIFSFYFNFHLVIQTINIWGTVILAIILGISLFLFREKQRFSYGVFEFFSGIGAIILVFYPNFDYSKLTYSFDFYAKLLGGLYIMVRGQDNIIKSLQGKKWGLLIKEKIGIG